MSNNTNQIPNENMFPRWWIEAITIEYFDCRKFASSSEIWEFRFDQVSKREILSSLLKNKVIIYGVIFHNIHQDSFKTRLIGRMVSNVPVPASMCPDDVIAEGPVSPHHFPFLGNPIEVWDPKLDFSTHFQVFDNGQLWQWKIAEFIAIEGRQYGKWISNEIDLEPLDQITPRLAELRNSPVRPGEIGHSTFERQVREFYIWLENLRAPIRRRLYEIHQSKRASYKGPGKNVPYPPPLLSKFEDFTVRDEEIHTRFHAEPIFYRALLSHSRSASKLIKTSDLPTHLDLVYQERVQAVINAAACLEAFINSVGSERIPNWGIYEQLPPETKWHLCLAVHGKDKVFDPSREPYQTFGKVIDLRNRWLHYKRPLERVRRTTKETVTWIEAKMDARFIEDLPEKVALLIKEFCEALGYPVPAWLQSGPGWNL